MSTTFICHLRKTTGLIIALRRSVVVVIAQRYWQYSAQP
jgi:hypothetical protein